ncbi:MAG: restriction endonuclease subunit S [Candidatus Thermoplasmatota archaeon]|nr:restriction endonuclease subunit S [Candidatus Thermoplasmatota archaeon]MCL5889024.1 restriction endonuclease subunit S [Candidatus Thermoplasmatota archaeon]
MNFNKCTPTDGYSKALDLPSGWVVNPVKELAVLNEKNLKRNSSCHFIEYIDIDSVEEGIIKKTKSLPITKAPSRAKRIVKNKDILISSVRPNLKHYCRIREAKLCTIASTGFIVLTPNEIDPDFLYYSITTERYTNYLSGIAETSTTAYPSITSEVIAESFIHCPPLEEQHSISKILSDLDSKIELNQQMNKTLEAMAQTLFKHWFIDFEFPDESGQPYKSSGGEMVDSEIDKIPIGWSVNQVKDLGQIVCGKTPSTKISDHFGEDYPFIKIPDMRGLLFTEKTETKLSKKGSNLILNKKLPPMSVCVSCIATPGLVTLTSIESYTNQQINSIICKDTVSPYYVYFQMKAKRNEILAKGSSGTATLNLNTGDFSNIWVLIPSQNVMENFHRLVQPMFNQILSNQREFYTLTEIRDQILPRLISGKIRIPMEE